MRRGRGDRLVVKAGRTLALAHCRAKPFRRGAMRTICAPLSIQGHQCKKLYTYGAWAHASVLGASLGAPPKAAVTLLVPAAVVPTRVACVSTSFHIIPASPVWRPGRAGEGWTEAKKMTFHPYHLISDLPGSCPVPMPRRWNGQMGRPSLSRNDDKVIWNPAIFGRGLCQHFLVPGLWSAPLSILASQRVAYGIFALQWAKEEGDLGGGVLLHFTSVAQSKVCHSLRACMYVSCVCVRESVCESVRTSW